MEPTQYHSPYRSSFEVDRDPFNPGHDHFIITCLHATELQVYTYLLHADHHPHVPSKWKNNVASSWDSSRVSQRRRRKIYHVINTVQVKIKPKHPKAHA
jgi:hypothetical protein